ncbi:MAG TPA: J domain-containing protein [Vicinamibacteria bacterium]|nr:J domain-containing protein [Vicinamibacteria bacterium]
MEFKDYYKTLGVSRTATDKEIKAAYRRLARKHHPDVNKGDPRAEARFKEINEANAVLSDPVKRRRYDTLGPDWAAHARPGPRAGASARGGQVHVDFGEDLGGFSEFFRTIFGGGFGGGGAGGAGEGFPGGGRGGFREVDLEEMLGRASAAGQDVETPVELTLDEILRGTSRTIQVGEGGAARRVEVKIPAGVREGARVRVGGEGAPGRQGGPRGDLYLRVRTLPHAQLQRAGDDLKTAVTVPLTIAVLGGEGTVPTLEGPVGIKIPPGSRSGRVFRLRGHGLPQLADGKKGQRGDLLAELAVDLPQDLTPRERELFEELRRGGR